MADWSEGATVLVVFSYWLIPRTSQLQMVLKPTQTVSLPLERDQFFFNNSWEANCRIFYSTRCILLQVRAKAALGEKFGLTLLHMVRWDLTPQSWIFRLAHNLSVMYWYMSCFAKVIILHFHFSLCDSKYSTKLYLDSSEAKKRGSHGSNYHFRLAYVI